MKKPELLHEGDRVAIVAPCSAEKKERVDRVEEAVKAFGLEPVIYPGCYERHGYLSGNDQRRAADLNGAFADKSIKGIIALRGGYGSARLLPMLDYGMIRENPKVFVGYSDVTALHVALNQICGFVTYHGLMASAWKSAEDFTMQCLREHIMGPEVDKIENPPGEKLECITPGVVFGRIIGGNLCMLVSTLGSPYEIDTEGKILFIEEVGEEPYRVDRMLNSLALAGKLRDAAGIILGTWTECEAKDPSRELTLMQIFQEHIGSCGKPAVNNLRAGHISPQVTIPLGAEVELDAVKGAITLV